MHTNPTQLKQRPNPQRQQIQVRNLKITLYSSQKYATILLYQDAQLSKSCTALMAKTYLGVLILHSIGDFLETIRVVKTSWQNFYR